MYDTMRVSQDDRKKSESIVYYDHTKGGVDVVDLVEIGEMDSQRKLLFTRHCSNQRENII